jgi:tetratricopeptide (TPR) repeat protein
MDRYQEALDLIEAHDKVFERKWEARAGWPLIKLERFEETERRMGAILEKGEPYEKIVALNTIGAMHWQKGDTEKSRDCFVQITEISQENGYGPDATILSNKAESEIAVGNYSVAEADLREGGQNFSRWNSSNPHQAMCSLLIDAGRFREATDSAYKMFAWSRLAAPPVRGQSMAATRKQFAAYLLAAGYPEQALPILEEMLHRPARTSNTSDRPYREECWRLFMYQDCLDLVLAKKAEERSWSPFTTRVTLWLSSLTERGKAGDALERATGLLIENEVLGPALVPYQNDWVAPPWLLPDLIEAVGTGVMAVQCQRDLKDAKPWGAPYLRAYLGEARLSQGRYEEALPILEQALQEVPSEQALVKARIRLGLAVCAEQLGRQQEAMQAYQRVLEVDPNAFRRAGRSLPVKLSREGGPAVAAEVARLLRRSPRFREESYGLPVVFEEMGSGVRLNLVGTNGSTLVWTSASTSEQNPDLASAAAQRFHEVVFAPRVQLSQTDINAIQSAGPEALGL